MEKANKKPQKNSIAKICRPHTGDVLIRERLFTLLDAGHTKPLFWITAPGGSGKSTLAASFLDARKLPCIWYQCDEGDADLATFFYYMGLAAKKAKPGYKKPLPLLTPEYLAGISTFTRRYFEILFSCCKTIVLDNYQDVSAAAPFHDMIATAIDTAPDGVRVVVLSRTEPPPAMARLQANGRMNLLNYSDIRLTFCESMELVQGRILNPDNEFIRALHEKTAGWAAGMILMLERMKSDGTGADLTADFPSDSVFDYFAGEIFSRAEHEVQQFLLKTAFLPSVSVPLAGKLTGLHTAGKILATLHRHNFLRKNFPAAASSTTTTHCSESF